MSNIPDFLIKKLNNQYGVETTEKILEGYNKKRYTTFRVNTLKISLEEFKEKIKQLNIDVEPFNSITGAFILKSDIELLKNTEFYKNGYIYLQSLSSMLPVILLEPKDEHILDMAAAPGSKTTQIAMITSNKARITACEKNNIRAERLKFNLQKQGVTCCYVMVTDATKLDDLFSFDKILLDAPCSGSGTIYINNPKLKEVFKEKLITSNVEVQTKLLRKALNILKPDKEMIYSTCSILKEENEGVLNKVLKEANATIVPLKLNIDNVEYLNTTIEGTICICPNEYYEGFFIAKIKKCK